MSGLESSERLQVLHLGIEPPLFEARENPKTPLVALSAGNLIPVKGHRYLLQAMWMLRQRNIGLELLIAGDGKLRFSLENLALDLGIGEQIRFLGQLRHEELLQLYAEGRVFMTVLPSVDLGNGLPEGIPVSLIEAMSFAIPVIGTNAGGTPELLDGGAGLLVPAADARALADAMELLTVNDELRCRIGAAGRKRVEEQFNVRTIAKELLRLMQVSHSC
jgi:glycosyltransferase involved in cell wall biosynthesis